MDIVCQASYNMNKRKLIKKLMTAVFAFLVIAFLCSCGGNNVEKRIAGSWELNDELSDGGYTHFEIYSDHTIETGFNRSRYGDWSLVNGDKLKIEWRANFAADQAAYTDVFEIVSIDNKTLILENDDYGECVYDKQ